jgi:DNA repair photolyase
LIAISVELLVNSIAWHAASTPTLRLVLFVYTVSLMAAKEDSRYLRGARSFVQGRFESALREPFDDGWAPEEKDEQPLETSVTIERARSIISRNDSPDVSFTQSINPYRGCEHGCIYCYARPSHAYLELSPGLDFETKLFAKTNAPELLRAELSARGYQPSPIALGANTDCYQPIERKYKITRGILEVLSEFQHPLTIVTKSALIERDLDILAPMAKRHLVKVFVSIGSLDRALARKLEPRAASPQRRLDVLRALSENHVPCGVMVAALIPALNDKTLEHVLEAAAEAGAREAAYVIMRLPNELKTLFKEWLAEHYPERAEHVISIVRQMRGGRDNDPSFGTRMSGTGKFAELVEKRFDIACRRLHLNDHGAGRDAPELDCSLFRVPGAGGQMALF